MKSLKALLTLTAGVAVGLTAAQGAHAQEIEVSQTRPNSSMLTSGAFAIGVPYVASVIVAAESNHPGDKNLFIPVAGPWLDLSQRHCPMAGTCGNEGLYTGLLIANGIFQGVGALQIAGAFLFPETITVTEHARDGSTRTVASLRFTPAMVGGAGYGVSANGAF